MGLFLCMVFVVSLSGVMAPGPVFAVTLVKGTKDPLAGGLIALGHEMVELPVIVLVLLGSTVWLRTSSVRIIVGIMGGGLLCWMGSAMFRLARAAINLEERDLPYPTFLAGAMTTAANPYFLLWWATVGSVLALKAKALGILATALFIGIHFCADLLWCLCVSVLSHRMKHLLSGRIYKGMLVISGMLLIGFGVWFVIDSAGFFRR